MIICPWCGTNYLVFQPNCQNCGGPLPATDGTLHEDLLTPPMAPRPISERYVWRLLSSDGWWIAALVFCLLGGIFSLVGAGLTIAILTAFVGIPFLFLGLGFLAAGAWIFLMRYQDAQQIVRVLREGEAARGRIVEIHEDLSVRVNGRNPWKIQYQFQAGGQSFDGSVSTLNQPGEQLQAGREINVLYFPAAPKWNSIYPHP